MKPHVSPATRRAHMDTQRRLLEAERDAQARLAAVAHDAASSSGLSPAALRAASDAVRDAVASEVERLRGEARRTGRATLAHELRVSAEDARVHALARLTLAPPVPSLADQIAGQRVGNTYAAAWLTRAATDGPAASTRMTRHRLNGAAGAEVGQAFSGERDAMLKQLDRHTGAELKGVVLIIKLWDARLDACPRCRDLDGQVRPIGIDFRGGAVPGLVHKRCRCISGVVVLPAITMQDAA